MSFVVPFVWFSSCFPTHTGSSSSRRRRFVGSFSLLVSHCVFVSLLLFFFLHSQIASVLNINKIISNCSTKRCNKILLKVSLSASTFFLCEIKKKNHSPKWSELIVWLCWRQKFKWKNNFVAKRIHHEKLKRKICIVEVLRFVGMVVCSSRGIAVSVCVFV